MNIKTTSKEGKLLDVLKSSTFYRTIAELIYETAEFGEPDWTRKQISTTINRLKKKGIEILVKNAHSPKVSYKYKASEDIGVEPVPMETVVDDTLLDKVLDITKPVEMKEAPDLFSDEEIEMNSPINKSIKELFDDTYAVDDEEMLEDYTYTHQNPVTSDIKAEDVKLATPKNILIGIADIPIKIENERYPKPTTESLMHFIMANKPKTIKVSDVQAHYGLNLADAACLMIRTGDKFDSIHVKIFGLTGVAL